jgi:hypothetical protein
MHMPTAPPADLQSAHRWFAVEFNNLAWSLIESPARTVDETETLIHAAHASVHHWIQIGTLTHAMRGLCLLSTAYVAARDAPAALKYARRCVTLLEQGPPGHTDFDRATALGCLAHALALANDPSASSALAEAQRAADALDADDRAVFEQLYVQP